MTSRVSVIIQDVPAKIALCVEDQADERNIPIGHVIGEMLGSRYGIAFDPPREQKRPDREAGSSNWVVRVSPELREAIRADAEITGDTIRGVCLQALAERCGIENPWNYRSRRRKEQVA